MTPFFLVLNHFGMLRSEAVEELVGLDVCYNGEEAFDKENSDGDDAALRDEYMTAYEDYRQNRSKHKTKVVIPAERPHENTDDSNSGSARGEKFVNEEEYEDTTSV